MSLTPEKAAQLKAMQVAAEEKDPKAKVAPEAVEYPKWLYHKSKPAILVADASAHKDAGHDWFESPGEAEAGKAHPKK